MRKRFVGAAQVSELAAALEDGNQTLVLRDIDGWPAGPGDPFVVVVDRGGALEEKLLLNDLDLVTGIATIVQRGYDDTEPYRHDVGAQVVHVLDSDTVDEANAHVHGRGVHLAYTHIQYTPAATWVIPHNLGGHPAVTVVDSAGTTVFGDVQYASSDTIVITFAAPFAGRAYLS